MFCDVRADSLSGQFMTCGHEVKASARQLPSRELEQVLKAQFSVSLCLSLCLSLLYAFHWFQFSICASVRHSPTMRPQQDFSKFSSSYCCPLLLLCSFLVPLGLLSHYPSTSLVVFLCFLFPPLVHAALLPVVYFPPSLLPHEPYFSDFVYHCNLLSQLLSNSQNL